MSDELESLKRRQIHLETILQEINAAISEDMDDLGAIQGLSSPPEGLYDPIGLQENIDKLRSFRTEFGKQLEQVKKRIKELTDGS